MKLIYIANARIPTEKAHGIQIMQMLSAFADMGMKVELLVPRRLNPIKQDPFEYYGVKRNFKVIKLPTLDLIFLGFGSFGFFAETFIFLIASAIYLFFRRYDILYIREPLAGLFFKDVALEIHSLPKNINFLQKIIWRRAKALLVLTSFIKNELIKYGVPENKILILPDAVDLEKFDIKISKEDVRRKLNLPQDKKITVYTGQLFDWKGTETLIQAGEILKFQNINIYIVGGQKQRSEPTPLTPLPSSGGGLVGGSFPPNLILVGQRPHAEIPLWLKAADVLILPNTGEQKISRYYTSPMKMFEYMASGRPIVASDLPSLREILTENDALFFKPGDSQDLSRAIKEVLLNPTLADRISQNALQKVQNYTWDKRARKVVVFLG